MPKRVRITGTGTVISDKRKPSKKSTALVVVGKERHRLSLADVGALVLKDAEETVRQQIQENITRIAEHVIGRIQYWKKQLDQNTFMLAEFERKRAAILQGEFSVNKFDGTVTFHDQSLEKLG